MKLIVAIVKNEDVDRLTEQLVKERINATKLASSGGFLGEGNTTLLIGTDAASVEAVISIIRRCCFARQKFVTQGSYEVMPMGFARPIEVTVGGATIFVLNVNHFQKICELI